MKRATLFLSLILFIALPLFADHDGRAIIITPKGEPRSGYSIYIDMPAAYYEYDVKTQEITIDGNGSVSYYDVEITTPVTGIVEISIQVDGDYDAFSISSLPTGAHVITITSPSGNVFEGTI